MANHKKSSSSLNDDTLDDATRRDQLKLVYDYIKFHIGLYIGTPAVIGLLGNTFKLLDREWFQWGLMVMICLYIITGAHAAWFMGKHVNVKWTGNYLVNFE